MKKSKKSNSAYSYSLELPSTLDHLGALDLFMEKIQLMNALEDTLCIKLDVILNETVVNAIVHGNKMEASKRVSVEVAILEDKVIVQVGDEGAGFDGEAILANLADDNIHKIQERGLFIVKKLADGIKFNNLGNRITITIKIKDD